MIATTQTKFCPSCRNHLFLEEFARDSRVPIGRTTYCKGCKRTKNREHRERKESGMSWIETAKRTHLAKDYSQSKFLKRMGLKNPVAIVEGTEMLVRCECGTVVSREEASDSVEYLPTIDEIYAKAKEIRTQQKFFQGMRKPSGPMIPGIREVKVITREHKRLES